MATREVRDSVRIRNVQLRTGKPHIATARLAYGPCWVYMPALVRRSANDDQSARRAADKWMRRVCSGWSAWRRCAKSGTGKPVGGPR